jgi:AcrR family transcriptional regulator
MSKCRSDFERILEDLIRQHAGDKDAGYGLHDHIVGWLRSASPEDKEVIRQVLLGHLRRGLPAKWGIALEVLAEDPAPEVPAQFEAIARSFGGPSQRRDEIIVKLARMGHRPALDLCLDGLQAGAQFQADRCILLANLIKLDPEVALSSAVSYFVEEMCSSDRRRSCAANCSSLFLTVYSEVNPDYTLELVRRTMNASPRASGLLIGALLRWCSMLLTCSGLPNEGAIQALRKQLEELDQRPAHGYLRKLVLSSTSPSILRIGQAQAFTIVAEDGTGAPIAQLLISLHVVGANPQVVENTTDSKGCATLTYAGLHPGADQVQAFAIMDGPAVISNKVRTLWVSAVTDGA